MRITDINPRYQPLQDMCFQTALKIAFDELCKSFEEVPKLSINKISKLSKYDRGVRDLDYAYAQLNKYLNERHYKFCERSGIDVEMSLIDKILSDGNASVPIVTVGASWLSEMYGNINLDEIPENDEHELIVLDLNQTDIIVYDTYAPFRRSYCYDWYRRISI